MSTRVLYAVLVISLIVPISTTLIYGSPQFPDTWIQMRVAKEAFTTGHLRVWDSYDTNWPLVNVILSLTSYLTGLDLRYVIYVVLIIITGLSIIPLYMILYYRNKTTIYSIIFLLGVVFEPMYLTLISSFQKEAAPLMILNLLLLFIVASRRVYPVIFLLVIGVLLGHHFVSLYVLLLFITVVVYEALEYLRKGEPPIFNIKIMLFFIILISVYQYFVGFRFIGEFEYYRFSQSDIIVLTSFYVLSFILVYGRRGESVRPSTQVLIFIILCLSYISIRYIGVFGFNLPKPSILELIVVLGYILLVYNSLKAKDYGLDKAIIPAIALTLYGITLEPIYGGVTVLIKALRRIIPLLSLQAAIKPFRVASILFLAIMLLAFLAHIQGYVVFGGPAIYKLSEVEDARSLALLVNGNDVRCSWRTGVLLKYYNPNLVLDNLLMEHRESLLIVSEIEIHRGLMGRVWYQYIPVDVIERGKDVLYTSGVFYVYR